MTNILPTASGECHRCRFFHGKMVGGFAPRSDVKLIVVSASPGNEEERRGIPLVGPAGQMLRDALRAIKLDPELDVAYLHALRCAPMGKDVKDAHLKACRYWLYPELDALTCKHVLLCGGEAVRSVLPASARENGAGEDQAVAKLRGRWYDADGRRLRVTFNPAYVERMSPLVIDGQGDLLTTVTGRPRKRAPLGTVPNFFWRDVQAVGQELGLC